MSLSRVTEMNVHIADTGDYCKTLTVDNLVSLTVDIFAYLSDNVIFNKNIVIAFGSVTAVYQILSTGEVWNPTDLFKIDMPEPLKEKQKEKAIAQAKKLLISEGILSESQLAS